MTNHTIQTHIFITGKVQGVGYRFWTLTQAKKLGINGWVKNLNDGRVEAVLMGEEKAIKQMVALCYSGSRLAKVTDVMTKSEIPEEFSSFEIL